MQQLVSPNLGMTSSAGLCLYFARSAFGAPAVEASAWAGWLNTKYKHTDALPNVCVPVWFQHFGSYGTPARYDNWGHVAIYVPGRGFLSSPITFVGPGQQWFGSLDELVNAMNRIVPGSKTAYVGWSEDISNVRVAKENDVAIIANQDNWKWRADKTFQMIRGRAMGDGEMNPWVGQDFLHLIEALEDNPEADQWFGDGKLGRQARIENWTGQIDTLKAQLSEAQKSASDALNSGNLTKSQLQDALQKIADLEQMKSVPQETIDQIKETNTIVKSLKGMLVNFIGWVKAKLGR